MKRIMVKCCMECPYRSYNKKKVTGNIKIHYKGQVVCGLSGAKISKRVKKFPKTCQLLEA